jgi:hypothetical protein
MEYVIPQPSDILGGWGPWASSAYGRSSYFIFIAIETKTNSHEFWLSVYIYLTFMYMGIKIISSPDKNNYWEQICKVSALKYFPLKPVP